MSHATNFFDLKAQLGNYRDTIDAEIAALQAKRDILSAAIELTQTCGEHCEANGIGD